MSDTAQIILLAWLFVIWYLVSVYLFHKKKRKHARMVKAGLRREELERIEAELLVPIDEFVRRGEDRAMEQAQMGIKAKRWKGIEL